MRKGIIERIFLGEYEIIPKMDREVKYIIPNFTSTDATDRASQRIRRVSTLGVLAY